MKVSVIIPTYNRAKEVSKAVESVLNQTVAPLELIVVDDGSTDRTQKVLKQFSGVRIIRQPHLGVSRARNRGIAEARGDWIAFLDSDDLWLPQKLEKQISYHKRNPFLISQTEENWIRKGKRVNPRLYHQKREGDIYLDCLRRCLISPSAVLIKKELFEEVGLFDESLPACEDYDMWLRVAWKYPVGLVKEKLVVKTGGHRDQLSAKYWGMDRFRVKALEKVLAFPLVAQKRQESLKILIQKLTILAQGAVKRKKAEEAGSYRLKLERYKRELLSEQELNLLLSLPESLASYISEKKIAYRRFEHLKVCSPSELKIFTSLVENLSPSASLFEEITRNSVQITRNDRKSVSQLLKELKIGFQPSKESAKKLQRTREKLIERRYPLLSKINQKIANEIQKLGSDCLFDIKWDKTLEEEGLDFSFRLRSSDELAKLIESLKSINKKKLIKILELLK